MSTLLVDTTKARTEFSFKNIDGTMERLKKRTQDLEDENATLRAQFELLRGSRSVSADAPENDGARY